MKLITNPCHGEARKTAPLFADNKSEPYTYAVLDKWLHSVLASLYDEQTAVVCSWHALRIGGFACALCAAECPDENSQLICRWATTNNSYARLGTDENTSWTDTGKLA
eukprot:3650863-Pleurochrysis_carterae.AAC.1